MYAAAYCGSDLAVKVAGAGEQSKYHALLGHDSSAGPCALSCRCRPWSGRGLATIFGMHRQHAPTFAATPERFRLARRSRRRRRGREAATAPGGSRERGTGLGSLGQGREYGAWSRGFQSRPPQGDVHTPAERACTPLLARPGGGAKGFGNSQTVARVRVWRGGSNMLIHAKNMFDCTIIDKSRCVSSWSDPTTAQCSVRLTARADVRQPD